MKYVHYWIGLTNVDGTYNAFYASDGQPSYTNPNALKEDSALQTCVDIFEYPEGRECRERGGKGRLVLGCLFAQGFVEVNLCDQHSWSWRVMELFLGPLVTNLEGSED